MTMMKMMILNSERRGPPESSGPWIQREQPDCRTEQLEELLVI